MCMHRIIRAATVSLALLFVSSPIFGQETSFSLYSSVLYEHFSFLSDLSERDGTTIDARNEVGFAPKLEFAHSAFDAVAALEYIEDLSDDSRSKIYLREGYIDLIFDTWDVRVGRQFIAWGRADAIKPTDQFKRRDYTDLTEDREEATLAVKGDYYVGNWTLEGVWAPVFEEDILPYNIENRWVLLPTTRSIPISEQGDMAEFNLLYQIDLGRTPPKTSESSQAGLRLSGDYGGWDLGLMYAYSYDRIPTFVEEEIVSLDPEKREALVRVTPRYKRIQVAGFDWATTLSKLGLRGELAYTLTEDRDGTDPQIDDPYLRVVGGIDYNFVDLIKDWDLFTIVQYALDTEVPKHGKSNQEGGGVSSYRHFYQHAILLNAEFEFSEFSKLALQGIVNVEEGDYLLQPEFSWGLADGLNLTFGVDILGGGEDTFFGFFGSNDRIRIGLKSDSSFIP